jgi:hypothetical protein
MIFVRRLFSLIVFFALASAYAGESGETTEEWDPCRKVSHSEIIKLAGDIQKVLSNLKGQDTSSYVGAFLNTDSFRGASPQATDQNIKSFFSASGLHVLSVYDSAECKTAVFKLAPFKGADFMNMRNAIRSRLAFRDLQKLPGVKQVFPTADPDAWDIVFDESKYPQQLRSVFSSMSDPYSITSMNQLSTVDALSADIKIDSPNVASKIEALVQAQPNKFHDIGVLHDQTTLQISTHSN